ncbi:amino acid permease [Streptomyces sp. LUP47B]|uniref:amino acid permease n=2 Tax=Streptomyces TaxID=1883 RepID=UPI00210C5075|nr:amino acid permease [Streptomyces sp. LUP47B]
MPSGAGARRKSMDMDQGRDPSVATVQPASVNESARVLDEKSSSKRSGLSRAMKSRHIVMIGLGSAIGTGLFVGSGSAMAAAGPAVLLAYIVGGILVTLVMRMLGEMAAEAPSAGALSVFADKALGRTVGSTIGWLWWAVMVVSVAAEATAAAAIVHSLWPAVSQWLLALVFLTSLTGLNLLGVAKFGETEFWFTLLKVGAILAMFVVGGGILLGWIPVDEPTGFGNLVDRGGFMPNGISGVASALLMVVFAFGGVEIAAIAAAETKDPARNIGRAIRTIVLRIVVFYVGAVLIMLMVLPWNDSKLKESPFIAVLTFAGIPGAGTIMALVIVVALLSGLNANVYGASRLLFSLSDRGCAPSQVTRVTGKGVPRIGVLLSVAFGFAAVMLNYIWPTLVLKYLLNAVGSGTVIIWFFVIITQFILRRRMSTEKTNALAFKVWLFPYANYLALAILGGIVVLTCFDDAGRSQLLTTFIVTAAIAVACRLFSRAPSPKSLEEQV